MKTPLVDSEMENGTRCALVCAKKRKDGRSCRRYIVGTFSNPYFYSPVMPGISCDLRNKEWRCWQHGDVTEFGSDSEEMIEEVFDDSTADSREAV